MPMTRTPKEGWWGAKLGFVSAGFSGYDEDEPEEDEEAHKRKAFTEADQEKAYMQAHLNKKQGHGGLGLGKPQGPSKLGNDFVGTKKKFGDDEEEEEEQEKAKGGGSKKRKAEDEGEGRRKRRSEKVEGTPEGQDVDGSVARDLKWKKIVRRLLEGSGEEVSPRPFYSSLRCVLANPPMVSRE